MKKKVSLFLAALLLASALAGCGFSGPASTIKDFESAYNDGDVNGMLDCFDPAMTKGIRATLNIAGAFLPINPNDILDAFHFLYSLTDRDSSWEDEKPRVSIAVKDTDISGDTAMVTADMVFTIGGEKDAAEVCFYMEKHADKWYIHDILEL